MARLVYELSFKGAASEALAGAFDDCEVETDAGITRVRTVADQAALHGLLDRIRALALELLEVRLVAEPAGRDQSWLPDRPDQK